MSFIDNAYIEVDGQELDHPMSIEITDEQSGAEPVETMTRARRALGTTPGNRAISYTITSKVGAPREFDWHELYRTRKIFTLVYQDGEDGERWQLRGSRVLNIGRSRASGDQASDQFTCFAAEHEPE
jgi:hypothetical protein